MVWHTFHYAPPDPAVADRENIRCHRLISGRLWSAHAILGYQGGFDGIFYPGNEWFDAFALKLRTRTGRSIPTIATMEGLPGDEKREMYLSRRAGHPVKCFHPRGGRRFTESFDAVRASCNLNIAISPFLMEMGQLLYGGHFAVLPLGVESGIFNPHGRKGYPDTPLVIGAGTLYHAKRPETFLRLAAQFPDVTFEWIGDGPLRSELNSQVQRESLGNLTFLGPLDPRAMARRFKSASFFVLPSHSEGVPKVTQEASACGLPVVLFGYYQAPSVVHGVNGYVVWSDEELVTRVAELIADSNMCATLGAAGIQMARAWDWDVVADKWESMILEGLNAGV